MKIIYKSHDGFLFLSNPFDNANYYLEILTVEEFKNLDSEKRLSLYFDLLQIKFRIFDFENFQNLKASTQELYKITAKNFFSFLCNIENFVNANDYQELLVFHENFDTSIVENKTEFDSFYRKEMEGLDKEISTIISKKNIVTDIKESAVFKTAVEFAKIDGIYSLINKKEFYHKNGTINSTALSIFLFKDTSCRTQIGVTINKELDDIEAFLPQAVDVLKPEARLAVISFHSLEDRLIKQFIQKESTLAEDTSWGMPQQREDTRRLKKVSRVRASDEEVKANPRSRSAWLRAAERLA